MCRLKSCNRELVRSPFLAIVDLSHSRLKRERTVYRLQRDLGGRFVFNEKSSIFELRQTFSSRFFSEIDFFKSPDHQNFSSKSRIGPNSTKICQKYEKKVSESSKPIRRTGHHVWDITSMSRPSRSLILILHWIFREKHAFLQMKLVTEKHTWGVGSGFETCTACTKMIIFLRIFLWIYISF